MTKKFSLHSLIVLFVSATCLLTVENHETFAAVGNETINSGLSYVVLQPESRASFPSQIKNENTIYEVRYAFNLKNTVVNMPPGCILVFRGGIIDNGVIIGDRTSIEAPLYRIFGDNLFLSGSWALSEAYPQWYGARGDGKTDDTEAIQHTLDNFLGIIRLPSGIYNVSKRIVIKDNRILEGVGSGTYLRESGYTRISAIRPTTNFSGDCVLSFDPANSSSGASYITGATCRRLLLDCYNIRNKGITIIKILSLTNPETFENIRIINNNSNVGLRVGRSSNKASFESDGLVFSNVVFLDGGAYNNRVPCAILGPCNEVSFRDCKFMPASRSTVSGSNAVLIDASQLDNKSRAAQGIVFDNCSFTASENALIIKGNKTDGNGPRNVLVTGCTFENVTNAIYVYSSDPHNKPVQFCTFLGNRVHTNGQGTTYLLGAGACNNEIFPLDNQTVECKEGTNSNFVFGGTSSHFIDKGVNNISVSRNSEGLTLSSVHQEPWVIPKLLNGWANASPNNRTTAAYRKTQDGKLELRGYLKSGNWKYPNNQLFVLSAECRPKTSKVITVGGERGKICTLELLNSGQVLVYGEGSLLLLDGVCVPLD